MTSWVWRAVCFKILLGSFVPKIQEIYFGYWMYFFQNIVNEIVKTWRCDVITFLRYVFQKNLFLLFTRMCWSVDKRWEICYALNSTFAMLILFVTPSWSNSSESLVWNLEHGLCERLEWSLKTISIWLILFNQRNVRYWLLKTLALKCCCHWEPRRYDFENSTHGVKCVSWRHATSWMAWKAARTSGHDWVVVKSYYVNNK